MSSLDYLMALKLQEELNEETNFKSAPMTINQQIIKRPNKINQNNDDLNATQNIVHSDWEDLDPTPDIYSMFGQFDLKFFQGKLQCVSLEWSKRMFNCAGICYTRRNRLGMQCIIRLSEPLLKLRSRKNLVETLLHEMIHAYLFVLGIREENGGHGANFKKIMIGINRAAGTNITVYHTFYNEVAVYKTHWWRCNGICQHRSPFFGYVKRTCNRQPGPSDQWWNNHKSSCGGTFNKIKEPEKKQPQKNTEPKNKKTTNNKSQPNIRQYLSNNNNTKNGKISPIKKLIKTAGRGNSTIVLPPSKRSSTITSNKTSNPNKTSNMNQPSTSTSNGNLSNVVDFRSLNSPQYTQKDIPSKPFNFTGKGHTLGTTNTTTKSDDKNIKKFVSDDDVKCLDNVRSSWNKRFVSEDDNTKIIDCNVEIIPAKRIKLDNNDTVNDNSWKAVDDDLMMHDPKIDIIEIDSDSDCDDNKITFTKPNINVERNENFIRAVKETFNDDEDQSDEIIIIDGEFNDNNVNVNDEILADTTVIDEFFGDDNLLEDFNRTNKKFTKNQISDIIRCPLCQLHLKRELLSEHLEGCLGIKVDVKPYNSTSKNLRKLPFYENTPVNAKSTKQTLLDAGYSADEIRDLNLDDNNDDLNIQLIPAPVVGSMVECPCCQIIIEEVKINDHLDNCIL